LADIKHPIFLSGGLNAGNVNRAIKKAHPAWVDASSSLELAPGKKDHKKVRKFIQAAKKRSR
jgi:phosphoribosylanthranilate isomerase